MKSIYKFLSVLLLFKTHNFTAQENVFFNINEAPSYNSYINYKEKDGILSNQITCITQDELGYIWFGSNKGLTRFDGTNFENFTNENGNLTQRINVLVSNKKNLYIGGFNFFALRNKNTFKLIENKTVRCIIPTENSLVIGTERGIYKLTKDFLIPIKTNLEIDLSEVNDIQYDGENYYIATNKALWKLKNLSTPKSIKKIEMGNFTSILILKNKVISSTLNSGLRIINNSKISTINIFTKNVKGIRKIGTNYWVFSLSNGIEILNNDFSFKRKINKYNSFESNEITDVFEDTQANIWLTTLNHGVFRFKSLAYNRLFVPSISFENIEVLHQPIDFFMHGKDKTKLKLTSQKNHLAFYYKSIDLNNPKNVLYRYKINGKYSPWTHKTSVNLANLQSGDYTFSVQSKLKNDQKSLPIDFNFYIDKPFYHKIWFKLSIMSFVFTIIGLVINQSIRKTQTKNKLKINQLELENHLLNLEQKALQLQMNPHFIFNVLNGVKALGNNGKLNDLNSTISKFSNLLRSILEASRKDFISLADEIKTLENYIDLEQQMSICKFTYRINYQLSFEIEEIMIPPMLIQPFIENSIKHGIKSIENGEITIYFSNDANYIHCEIIDNGVGFFTTQKKKRNKNHVSIALNVTKERIKSIDSKTYVKFIELKKNGEVIGTKACFKIPLKTDF